MKIVYWICTGLFGLGSLFAGFAYLGGSQDVVEAVTGLGYPVYFITIVGVWKVCGGLAVLLPGMRTIKLWAYAGFFYLYSGAFLSHLASGQTFAESIPALMMLLLMMGSYLLRDRRLD